MDQSRPKPPLAFILLLIVLGMAGIRLAFWLLGQPQTMPNFHAAWAASVGISFLSFTAAFVLWLRWRDRSHKTATGLIRPAMPYQKELEGTVYGLVAGREYQVIKPFRDFYGNSFKQGEILRFKERHFLPYQGGHTIVFDQRPLYLQEEKNKEILEDFSGYIVPSGNDQVTAIPEQ